MGGRKKTHAKFVKDLFGRYPNLENEILSFEKEYTLSSCHVEFTTKFGRFRVSANRLYSRGTFNIRSAIDKTDTFIRMAIEVHGDYYDYSKVEYVKSSVNVIIICPIHGEFPQTPVNHLKGSDCVKCGHIRGGLNNTKYTIGEVIELSNSIHNFYYDYSHLLKEKDRKVRVEDKIEIMCPNHGYFPQAIGKHISGQGCPKCANLRLNGKYTVKNAEKFKDKWIDIPAKLYAVICEGDGECFIKIGVTTNSTHVRFLGKAMPYCYEVIREVGTNLYDAVYMEAELHKYFEKHKYEPKKHFGGHTECFEAHCFDALEFDEIVEKHQDSKYWEK